MLELFLPLNWNSPGIWWTETGTWAPRAWRWESQTREDRRPSGLCQRTPRRSSAGMWEEWQSWVPSAACRGWVVPCVASRPECPRTGSAWPGPQRSEWSRSPPAPSLRCRSSSLQCRRGIGGVPGWDETNIQVAGWYLHGLFTTEDLKFKDIQDFSRLFEKENQEYFNNRFHFNTL